MDKKKAFSRLRGHYSHSTGDITKVHAAVPNIPSTSSTANVFTTTPSMPAVLVSSPEPTHAAPGTEHTPNEGASNARGGVAMEGHVVRRRDVVKAMWSRNYFVLQDGILKIYKRRSNSTPRRRIQITNKCSVGKVMESRSLTTKVESNLPKNVALSGNSAYKWVIKLDLCNWNGTQLGMIEFGVKTEENAHDWKSALERAIATAKPPEAERRKSGGTDGRKRAYSTDAQTPSARARRKSARAALGTVSTGTGLDQQADGGWRLFRVESGMRILIDDARAREMLLKKFMYDRQSLHYAVFAGAMSLLLVVSLGGSLVWGAFLGVIAALAFAVTVIRPVPLENFPTVKASMVAHATPDDVFKVIMGQPSVYMLESTFARMVQKVDDHTDIIHVGLMPVVVLGWVLKPRDLCLMRFWQRENDGSYLVVFQSTTHPACPPLKDHVRARLDNFAIHVCPLPHKSAPSQPKEHPRVPHSTLSFATRSTDLTHYESTGTLGGGLILETPETDGDLESSRDQGFDGSERGSDEEEEEEEHVSRMCLMSAYVRYDPSGWGTRVGIYGDVGMQFILPLLRSVIVFKDMVAESLFNPDSQFVNEHMKLDVMLKRVQKAEAKEPLERRVTTTDETGLVVGGRRIPCSLPTAHWAEPHGSFFEVRSSTFLQDKATQLAGPAVFGLVGVDLLSFEDPTECFRVCTHPANPIRRLNVDQDLAKEIYGDEPVPYTFVVNFVIPGPDNLVLVLYWQPLDPHWESQPENAAFAEQLADFLESDDDFRNSRFKLIPLMNQGSFVLKKAVGSRVSQKPAVPGSKGTRLQYYRGQNFFEVDVDVGSESHARDVTKLLMESANEIVVDLAVLFDAQDIDELPETILGTVQLCHVTPKLAQRVPRTQVSIPLHIKDRFTGTRIVPNARTPTPFENDIFKGTVLFKLATNPMDPYYEPYFRGKKRTFEVMVQGSFREDVDTDQVYLGIEGDQHLELSFMGKAMVAIMLKLLYALTPGAQASTGEKPERHGQQTELPWIVCMPLGQTVDRLIETPPDQEPPELGVQMLPEVMTKAEWCRIPVYKKDYTYTVSMHGMYVDFVRWAAVNIPGVGMIELRKLLGDSPIRIVAYIAPKGCKGPQPVGNKRYFIDLELMPET